MSDDVEIAKRVARILRIVAAQIEENPQFLKDIGINLSEIPTVNRKKKAAPPRIDFDIFEVYAKEGEEALHQKLEHLETGTLKKVISTHSFDPSKLADKWRNKERLINLILDRVSARSDKGKVFKEYP